MKNVQIIAHRGFSGHYPENTLLAFQKALDFNVGGIELDVHVCKTGELIVIHDETLDRTTNYSGIVSQMTLAEIKKSRIFSQQEVPTLTETLDLINKKCLVNIELKGENTFQKVAECIGFYVQNHQWSYTDLLVSSFDWNQLEKIKQIDSQITVGILTDNNFQSALEFALVISAKAIHPHYSLLNTENCKQASRAGVEINTWTVNDPAEIEQIKKLSINGIITDFPERI